MLAAQLVTVGCIQLPHLGVPSIAFESAYRVKDTVHKRAFGVTEEVSIRGQYCSTDKIIMSSLLLVNKAVLFCES
jgi:hypothetical protein